jgi:hypothetical protein
MPYGLIQDKRPIKSVDVYPFDENSSYYQVPRYDKIEVIEEVDGSEWRTPWVVIWKDGEIIQRIAARHCNIMYEKKE